MLNSALENHGFEIVSNCKTILFISKRYKGLNKLRNDKTIALNESMIFNESDRFFFSNNPIKTVCFGYGVIYGMLQVAVWMGINELYLYGIDHTFSLPSDYKKPGIPVTYEGEQNHFILNYRDKGEKWAPPNPKKTEAALVCARTYCEEHGIKIYNCTRGGKLEVFERKSLDEILS